MKRSNAVFLVVGWMAVLGIGGRVRDGMIRRPSCEAFTSERFYLTPWDSVV